MLVKRNFCNELFKQMISRLLKRAGNSSESETNFIPFTFLVKKKKNL